MSDAPDLNVIAAEDALLDALGRGEPAPDGDDLAGLLASWRGDLDEPDDFDITAVLSSLSDKDLADEDLSGEDLAEPIRPAVPGGEPVPVQPVPLARPGRWRPSRRMRGYLTGVAAALVLIAGLAVGAGQAGPDSPLWPLARIVYPDRVDLRLAEYNIDRARAAVADGRYDDARRTLDKAAGNVDQIGDAKLAGKLRAQIEEIRRTLPPSENAERDSTSPSPAPSSATPAPATTAPTTPPAGGGQPNQPADPGGGTTPEQPGGIIPGLPAIPTPTLPIPLPTIPLPTLPILG